MLNKINQSASGQTVLQAAGDIHYTQVPHVSKIRKLSEKVKNQYVDDDNYKLIEKLEHFMTEKVEGEFQGLEKKLSIGERQDLLVHAMEVKEMFAKRINKEPFSPEAQELFVHLLSHVRNTFQYKIHSQIKDNASNKDVDELILNQILNPLYEDVGAGEVNIDMDDIAGMLYFLTGNCHINWAKK